MSIGSASSTPRIGTGLPPRTRSAAGGEPFQAEYRQQLKDGRYVWVRDECVPVRDEAGRIVTWQGILLDISGRVQAQGAQAQLAAVVASIPEAIGQSVRMLATPLVVGAVNSLLERARRGERIVGCETERVTKDGRRIDVSFAISPVHDVSGNVVALSPVARDVTELRRLQRERDRLYAELEAKFQRTAESQARLLPHAAPDVPGYDFAGVCLPARMVGGDFFARTSTNDGVRFSLGDIMGKGMLASLMMATVRPAFRAVASLRVSEAVATVNRSPVSRSGRSRQLHYLVPRQSEHRYRYPHVRGRGPRPGFPPPRDRRHRATAPARSATGVARGFRLRRGRDLLEPGDTLVVYSNGLPDARPELPLDPAWVAEQLAGLAAAQAMLERLVAPATQPPMRPDDLTLVIVRRLDGSDARKP